MSGLRAGIAVQPLHASLQDSARLLRDSLAGATHLINLLRQENRGTPEFMDQLARAVREGRETVGLARAASAQPTVEPPTRLSGLTARAFLQTNRLHALLLADESVWRPLP